MDLNEQMVYELYDINECIDWVESNQFKSISLQFSRNTISNATKIAMILQSKTNSEYYITINNMCCVDYTSIRHLTDSAIDAIIYFGGVCLTSPHNQNTIPVLHIFTNNFDKQSIEYVMSCIEQIDSNSNTIVLYETANTALAIQLMNTLNRNHLSFAKLNSLSEKWFFTRNTSVAIEQEKTSDSIKQENRFIYGPYVTKQLLTDYNLVVYIGKCNSLNLILECNSLLQIDIENKQKIVIDCDKELRKRIAKIEKFKEKSCSLVGIILSNPLPNVDDVFSQTKHLTNSLNKKPYFISLVQSLDEYKLGNFSQLNGLVIVTSCWCSTLLDALKYHIPILSWIEFEIACGLKRTYGKIDWNQSVNDDNDNECDDDSQLNESTNNQIIEAEVLTKNTWYGLEVNAGTKDASIIKDGLKGIASFYETEDYF